MNGNSNEYTGFFKTLKANYKEKPLNGLKFAIFDH